MEKIIKERIRQTRFAYKILLYIAFGIFWSLSNVGYSFSFLTWFTLIPFLFFIKYENFKNSIIFSWIFGTSAYFFHCLWMINPFFAFFITLGSGIGFKILGLLVGILITLIVSVLSGFMYPLAIMLIKYLSSKYQKDIFYLVIPIVLTLLDYFYPKLWYDQIGYSQYIFFKFSQVIDIFGVSFITFLVVSSNSASLILIESFLFNKNKKIPIFLVITVISLIVLSSIYGHFRVKQINELMSRAPKAKIGIVQGNFDGLAKMDDSKHYDMINEHNKLSEELLQYNPDLIVWPESAIPMFFSNTLNYFKGVKKFDKVPLVFGAHISEKTKSFKDEIYYNSLIFLDGDGKKIDAYYKIKLLPFVEEIPVPQFNFLMNVYGLSYFTRGNEAKIVEYGDIRIAPNICYEDLIPRLVAKSLKVDGKRANLILNATNDSWFGKSIETNIHLHISGFRSIENRRALVRSTCTGYSGVFLPNGTLKYKSKLFEEDKAVVEVPLLEIDTFYNKYGYLFIYVVAIFFVAIFLVASYQKIRFKKIRMQKYSKRDYKRKLYDLWLD